jgi:hypothetical protein
MKIKNKWDEEHNIEVGDWVGFKSDVEQYGKIKSIQRSRQALILENKDGFDGDYIGGDKETMVSFEDVWKEYWS